ncbi:hypothetical protein RND71_038175 [Anisodus tanguticus]|uniref:Uncharacterized protein n=1 Tax=Anisodus tanguticus TaxID=243964 RepID=A0AAE1QYI9_9SOLA|nr:hypothetical protein RND71_038175 [Anisodus tanguticus]
MSEKHLYLWMELQQQLDMKGNNDNYMQQYVDMVAYLQEDENAQRLKYSEWRVGAHEPMTMQKKGGKRISQLEHTQNLSDLNNGEPESLPSIPRTPYRVYNSEDDQFLFSCNWNEKWNLIELPVFDMQFNGFTGSLPSLTGTTYAPVMQELMKRINPPGSFSWDDPDPCK